MNDYLQLKKKIQRRTELLDDTIRELEGHCLVDGAATSRWREHLGQVRTSLQDALLRIAVVGSVKSGKSTLINTLAGSDLLRRGAGIITAFITRVHTDGDIGGWVELKSWPQVTDELNVALHMLPVFQEEAEGSASLDIRHPEDRRRLKTWLEKMQTEWRQTRAPIDPHFMILNGYLEGYAKVHENVGETVNRLIFDQHTIGLHRHYVGYEGQAAYVRDMALRHPIPRLGEKVEIADCQGSDSPNPLHFALLQHYLLGSHFLFYVISSRTGLREADFKLLDFIKTLRMFSQTFFVLNVDLDAHPHEEDLGRLVERVRKELSWLVPDPRLYAFSALYHLGEQLGDALPERELRRLDLWREEESLARRTEAGFASFREDVGQRIGGQRTRVLLGSGLSRLGMVAGGILDTARAQKRFMDHNLGSLRKSEGFLKGKQKAFQAILGTLENAIAGLKESLARELSSAVDQYFDFHTGRIVKETLDMIDLYPVDPEYRKHLGDYRQLVRELHRFYMEFRQSLSRYLVEIVNLRVIEFAKEEEAFLNERFKLSSHAFWSLFSTALEDYQREMARFQIELRPIGNIQECDLSFLAAITPPTFSAFVDQEAVGRGVMLIKFGLGRFTRFLLGLKAHVGRRKDFIQAAFETSRESESLQEAISLVKAEAKCELAYAFRDYQKTFKTAYLYLMLEAGTGHLLGEFKTRAEMAQLDFATLLKQSELEEDGNGYRPVVEILNRAVQATEAMAGELSEMRCAVKLE